jgi:hypothetical protein
MVVSSQGSSSAADSAATTMPRRKANKQLHTKAVRRIGLIDAEAGCDDGSEDEDEDEDQDPALGGFIVPDGGESAEQPSASSEEGEDNSGAEGRASTRSGRISRPNKRSYGGEMNGQRYL